MTEQKQKKLFNYIFIGIGVLAIIFGILCFALHNDFNYGYYVSWETYGGDAYTGIQNAAAATANNVDRLHKSISTLAGCIKTGFGFSFLICGFLILLKGYKSFLKLKQKEGNLEKESFKVQAEQE